MQQTPDSLQSLTFLILIEESSCQFIMRVARCAAIKLYTPPLAPAEKNKKLANTDKNMVVKY